MPSRPRASSANSSRSRSQNRLGSGTRSNATASPGSLVAAMTFPPVARANSSGHAGHYLFHSLLIMYSSEPAGLAGEFQQASTRGERPRAAAAHHHGKMPLGARNFVDLSAGNLSTLTAFYTSVAGRLRALPNQILEVHHHAQDRS